MKEKLNGDEALIEVDENSARKDKKPEVVVITGASAAMSLSSVSVVTNSLRLRSFKPP